jgi:ATP-dependent Clp endopeptidase proteolytic subunit ClpP
MSKQRRNNQIIYSKRNHNESDDEDESDISNNISVLNNSIFFYSDINNESALQLRLELKKLIDKHVVYSIQNTCDMIPIKLHINSPGGEVHHAIAIIDTIKTSPVPIHTIIEGEAVSAATLISVVAHKRYIHKNAHMLIHQLSSGFWGKMMELEDEFKNLKKYTKKLINIYKHHTSLTEEELKHILKKDILWDSKKCLKNGLVDEIIPSLI